MAITAATPKIIPNAVSNERTLLATTASMAMYKFAIRRCDIIGD